jgi:hypothetical protein
VRKVGVSALNDLNQNGSVAKFADGGYVDRRDAAWASRGPSKLEQWIRSRNNRLLGNSDWQLDGKRRFGLTDAQMQAYIKSQAANQISANAGRSTTQLQLNALAKDKSGPMQAARIAAYFAPGLGLGLTISDIGRAVGAKDAVGGGLASLGLIPGLGGLLKLAGKGPKKAVSAPKPEPAFDPFDDTPVPTAPKVEDGFFTLDFGKGYKVDIPIPDPEVISGKPIKTNFIDKLLTKSIAKSVLKNPKVLISTPRENIAPLGQSGRYKTVFEMKSRPEDYIEYRKKIEKRLFGVDPEDIYSKPIYGGLANPVKIPSRILKKIPGATGDLLRMLDPYTNQLNWYTKGRFSMYTLKKARGTATVGDSFNAFSPVFSLTGKRSDRTDGAKKITDAIVDLRSKGRNIKAPYIEAQLDKKFGDAKNIKSIEASVGFYDILNARGSKEIALKNLQKEADVLNRFIKENSLPIPNMIVLDKMDWVTNKHYDEIQDLMSSNPDVKKRIQNREFEFDPFADDAFESTEEKWSKALPGILSKVDNTPKSTLPDDFDPFAFSKGGFVGMKYFANGGFAKGTDTVPAMLSPGEFVMSAKSVSNYGVDFMNAMNQSRVMYAPAQPSMAQSGGGSSVVYLSPDDRALLRAAIDRPVNLYADSTRLAQSVNNGNKVLAQRGSN